MKDVNFYFLPQISEIVIKWQTPKVGEDGGYTNLVDEDGRPLETASKLRNR